MAAKRKLSAIDSDSAESSLPKKPRCHQTSIPTETTPTPSVIPSHIKIEATDETEKLRNILEATKNRLEQVEEDSKRKSALLSHIHGLVECAICKDYLRDPYTLECGHTTCLKCLRTWWTMKSEGRQEEFLRDAEFGGETNERDPLSTSWAQLRLQNRSRSHSTSVRHQQKGCPECRKIIQRRPVLDYRLRSITEALTSTGQPQRDATSSQQDVWEGIFPPADGSSMRDRQQCISAAGVQGRFQSPPFPISSSRDRSGAGQRRTERRFYNTSHPYTNPAVLQHLSDRYDPVREAAREMHQRRDLQRHYRAPSSSVVGTQITHEPEPDCRPLSQAHENPRLSVSEQAPRSQSHLPPPRISISSRRLVTSRSQSRPQSRPISQMRLPSIWELLFRPSPSNVILPPILIHNSSLTIPESPINPNEGNEADILDC